MTGRGKNSKHILFWTQYFIYLHIFLFFTPSNIYLSSQNAVQNHCLKSLCGPASAGTWIIITTTFSYTQSTALTTHLWVLELARVSTSALLPFFGWLSPTHIKPLTVKPA